MIKIGFTGTRKGLTLEQRKALHKTLLTLAPDSAEIHYGMCVGADEEFRKMVDESYDSNHRKIVGHPPEDKKYFAPAGCDISWRPKANLERNQNIVYKSEIVIACPHGPEKQRSGSWATIRHARESGKPVYIIWPSGIVESPQC